MLSCARKTEDGGGLLHISVAGRRWEETDGDGGRRLFWIWCLIVGIVHGSVREVERWLVGGPC